MFKPSGNPKVLELTKSIRSRSYNLSCLEPLKLEELNEKGKPKRLCAWCCYGDGPDLSMVGSELLNGDFEIAYFVDFDFDISDWD